MSHKSGSRPDFIVAIAEVLDKSDDAILIGVKNGKPVCSTATHNMTDEMLMRIAAHLLDLALEGTLRKLHEGYNG